MPFSWLAHLRPFGPTFTRIKIRRTAQVGGAGRFAPNSAMPKRILEGATPKERALKRQQLGTLQSLTVQPSTRMRYDTCVRDFLQFLTHNSLELPTQRDRILKTWSINEVPNRAPPMPEHVVHALSLWMGVFPPAVQLRNLHISGFLWYAPDR